VALHLYGVTRADAGVPEEVVGRGGGQLRLVTDDDLAVVVSDVDAERPAGAKDLLAHARVLEAYAGGGTVIPMQFGIALHDEDEVRERVLAAERESLRHLVASFEGRVQLTVQAFLQEEPALREVLVREPRLREERDALRGLSGPESQARQVELGHGIAEVMEQLRAEYHDLLLDRLDPLAEAVADNEPTGADQVLNAAFLLPRTSQEAFDSEVAVLRDDLDATLRIRYVGPQPPYAFVEAVRSGELAWD
jgi:hypothetical protein